jgi:DNA topoisomerase I
MAEKWKSLFHHGVFFPKEYEYRGAAFFVNGERISTSRDMEEVLFFWVGKIGTPYEKDKVFRKNYWNDAKMYLPEQYRKFKLEDWDFSQLIAWRNEHANDKPDVAKNKIQAEEVKNTYGFAELDGVRVPLGNFTVEPAGLFMARGNHPLRGKIKKRIQPEDVTINHSRENPPLPPKSHNWKAVIENKNGLYIASWVQPVTGDTKYVFFGSDSIVKQNSDKIKFDKAAKLASKLESIRTTIREQLSSNVIYTRKMATVTNLIVDMAIRVGDEKDEDEAETFGASTLQCRHISINVNTVTFDFLGKDSIRYYRQIEMIPEMVSNLFWLIKEKKPDQPIFDGIDSKQVNEYLGSICEGVTAKQFRTAYGCKLLAENLQKIDPELSVREKILGFMDANLEVAHKLNHHKAITPAQKDQIKNMKEKLKQLKQDLKSADKKHKPKIKEKITALEDKIDLSEKTIGVALGTSKTNYSDPRITYSYCISMGIDPSKFFTPTLQKKFIWAQDVESSFYKKYPNI